jgi:hypothetical protein
VLLQKREGVNILASFPGSMHDIHARLRLQGRGLKAPLQPSRLGRTCVAGLQEGSVTLAAARAAGGGQQAAVFGRSRALEKEYLRLTSMPTLDTVRPPAVLKQALRLVQQRWVQVCRSLPDN